MSTITDQKSNLPANIPADSALGTRLFFDSYNYSPLEFGSNDVDAVFGFFQSKGFSETASVNTGLILLKQAKIDNMPVFELIQTLKSLNGLQLSTLIGEVLNNNRSNISTLGFKVESVDKLNQTRNIIP